MENRDTPQRGVIAVVCRQGRLLVVRRSQRVVAPGAYCFPGGGVEAGESEPQALQREMLEELGVPTRPQCRIWKSTTAWGVSLSWWAAELLDFRLRPDPAEVESFQWLTVAEVRALDGLLSSNHEFLDAIEGGKIIFPEQTGG